MGIGYRLKMPSFSSLEFREALKNVDKASTGIFNIGIWKIDWYEADRFSTPFIMRKLEAGRGNLKFFRGLTLIFSKFFFNCR